MFAVAVPQLLLPQGADQFEHVASGVTVAEGRSTMPENDRGQTVVTVVEELLGDSTAVGAARYLAAEMAAAPDSAAVVGRLSEMHG
ncbi:hypothetical protein SAMN04487820_10377 [Actinopolyspora mzabensis]|uniref:Erythromycin biosynthesis protein CIII-like C-terminal domain-containing protein n=1 Tax=Actinopolyspora mzabensis TaxID=995066 RepID=A0A1G8XUA2_ACTMZ|nr:hypothetical protein SAMN04487820_10377 [Actinopolyspora mzabensis]